VRGWILHPQTFFDSAFVVTGLLAFLAWDRGANVSAIFEQLALGPDEIAWILQQRQGGSWREARPAERIRTSRQALYERYMTQWITGGAFLVFFAGISRVQVTGGQSWLRLTELGLPPQVVPAIVAYFLIGLVLASMARFAMLRAQWLFDGVETAPALPVRWQRISLLLILAIGLAAILLPLGSTWQAGRILGMILGFLIQVVMAIYLLILWLVTSVMALLLPTGEAPPPPPDLLQPSPVQPPPAPPVSTLPPWLGGAGFWLITIILSLFAVAYVFGRLGIRPDRESLRRLRSLLWERLRAWWESLRGLARDVQRLIPSLKVGTDQEAEAGRRPWRFIRLGALPPREKIRYFYLSTVRRAGERGVTRRPSQTPHEFVRDLESAWPEVELDVESLTEAFVAARYDAMPISEPEAKDVQTVWQRIKKALRRRWNRSDQDAGV
jgi:hypothetical protein